MRWWAADLIEDHNWASQHDGWKGETDYFLACTKVWEEIMVRLKAAAEGQGLGPRFSKDGLAS